MDESDEQPSADAPNDEAAPIASAQGEFDESSATVVSPVSSLEMEDFPVGMTPRELSHALQGEMLDQFLLEQFVGGGGMGVVFKARDTTLDRVVAVKVVASPSLSNEDLQRRFLVEAQSAARLDHPNIGRVYDSGRSRGLPYIVFEFIEGINIRDLVLNHGPLPYGDALSYCYQIAHALAHASERDVVHRDIKPSNILVTPDGQAKLVDMGLARFYQVDTQEEDLTNTGVTLGTFDYISPEQARDPRAADARSDIYSFGCTLFYMLVGHAPFFEGTPAQKLLQHQGDRPPELLALRPDLPEAVGKLVQRMLAKLPEDRPQSPVELLSTLSDLMSDLGLQTPQMLASPPIVTYVQTAQSWRHIVPWAVPLAALVLISVLMSSLGSQAIERPSWPPIQKASSAATNEDSNARRSTTNSGEESEPTIGPVIMQSESGEFIVPSEDVEPLDSSAPLDGVTQEASKETEAPGSEADRLDADIGPLSEDLLLPVDSNDELPDSD